VKNDFNALFSKFPDLSNLKFEDCKAEEGLTAMAICLPPFCSSLKSFPCSTLSSQEFPLDIEIFSNLTELRVSTNHSWVEFDTLLSFLHWNSWKN
jgi:hypothetical protein